MSANYQADGAAERSEQLRITEAVHEIAEHRASIEQAKGMLMYIYDIDADRAFELLKWRSQTTNVKLRAIAQRLAEELPRSASDRKSDLRSAADEILLAIDESDDPPDEAPTSGPRRLRSLEASRSAKD